MNNIDSILRNLGHMNGSERNMNIVRNADTSTLYEMAIKLNDGYITNDGSLAVTSGTHTGRAPKDKRLVYYDEDGDYIWWSKYSPNTKMTKHTFEIHKTIAIDFLNSHEIIFVFDGYAGWNKDNRLKVRTICTRPYHALFMKNMLINPTKEELENFGEPDFIVYNAGCQPANTYPSDVTSSTSIDFDFKDRQIVLLGTQYAGEMKKGIFTVMHYLMPRKNILSLHSSCNTSVDGSDVALFFGLSGTGKTTLSADPNRILVGDDEHCWYDSGVFNIEGGCYAKCVDLKQETEPDIWNAIRYGNVVENIKCYPGTKVINFADISITENTRASYPISHTNAVIPCEARHPNNIIFLCCDAFGVIPTVSLLTVKQAMYYFINGYTASIPGTVMGITEPAATFSACFGDAFITCHPKVYAELLAQKLDKHKSKVWLINTGWIKGRYGTEGATRCPLKYTRMIVDLIHRNELTSRETKYSDIFNLQYFNKINGIPEEVLDPAVAWGNKDEYTSTLIYLKQKFDANMEKLDDGSDFMKTMGTTQ